MRSSTLFAAAATAGLALAGAAQAQLVGGAVGGTVGGAIGSPGGTVGGALGGTVTGGVRGPDVRTPSVPPVSRPALPSTPALPGADARVQGSASADANAGPASASVGASLDTLATGMMVRDAAGRTIGRVDRIVRTKAGQVKSVLVASADRAGRTLRYAPSSLSVSGDVVIAADARAER